MQKYTICVRCIMDTSDPDIAFNKADVCKYCDDLYSKYQNNNLRTVAQIESTLQKAADGIKQRAKGAKYHCVLGMSGGVDSSFAADLIVEKMGLNPLIVHFDNGWNSTTAVENIKKIITKLNLDMQTYVIDWDEFRDLQRAFLRASVLDIEMLTDNAIYGAIIKIAKKHNIHCVISGDNFATESGLPRAWRWEKIDAKNINAIHRQYGELKLKNYPVYGAWKFALDQVRRKIFYFYPLDIVHYKKTDAMQLLQDKFGWRYYGGKHYESIFTKFYQSYILPTKFGIDKRRAHLSSLIRNNDITREAALLEIAKPLYESMELKQDFEYVCKKLGFTESEFQEIMSLPPKKHTDYPSDIALLENLKKIAALVKYKKPRME